MKLKTNISINKITLQLASILSLFLLSSLSWGQGVTMEAASIQLASGLSISGAAGGGCINTLVNTDNMPVVPTNTDAENNFSSGTVSITPNGGAFNSQQPNLSGATNRSSLVTGGTISLTNQVIDNNWHERLAVTNVDNVSPYDFNVSGEKIAINDNKYSNLIVGEISPSSDFNITNSQTIDTNTTFTVTNLTYAPNSTLRIADQAELVVSNNYTSADTATVAVTADFNNSNSIIPIVVSCTATLTGTLQVNFLNAPNVSTLYGTKLTIMTASSFEGDFSMIDGTLPGARLVGSIETNSTTGEESYVVTIENPSGTTNTLL